MPRAAPANVVQPRGGLEQWLAEQGNPFDFNDRRQLWELYRWDGRTYWFNSDGRPLPSTDRNQQDDELLTALKKDADVPRIVIVDKGGKPVSSINFESDEEKTIRATLDPLPEEPVEIFNSIDPNTTPSVSTSNPVVELGKLDFDRGHFVARAKWPDNTSSNRNVAGRDLFVLLSRLENQSQCLLAQSQASWEAKEGELPEKPVPDNWLDNVSAGFSKIVDTIETNPEVWGNAFSESVSYIEQNGVSLVSMGIVCSVSANPIGALLGGGVGCLALIRQNLANYFMHVLKLVVAEVATIRGADFPVEEQEAVKLTLDLLDAAGQLGLGPPSSGGTLRAKQVCKVLEPSVTSLRVMAPRFVVNFFDPEDTNVKRAFEISINLILQQTEGIVGLICGQPRHG